MTVEGLQEWYDEACLMVYNNKYQDGVQWHDEPCFKRYLYYQLFDRKMKVESRIQCKDSKLNN